VSDKSSFLDVLREKYAQIVIGDRRSVGIKYDLSVYWETLDTTGNVPEARAGASLHEIGNHIYLFGGYSRRGFNDIKRISKYTWSWQAVPTKFGTDPAPE
jgi:hypothetical protein